MQRVPFSSVPKYTPVAAALEEQEEEEAQEPENEQEVGVFELNGAQLVNQKEDDLSAVEWTKFNLDTGAAQTAIPIAWDSIKTEPGGEVTFKTASGELVQSEGPFFPFPFEPLPRPFEPLFPEGLPFELLPF